MSDVDGRITPLIISRLFDFYMRFDKRKLVYHVIECNLFQNEPERSIAFKTAYKLYKSRWLSVKYKWYMLKIKHIPFFDNQIYRL